MNVFAIFFITAVQCIRMDGRVGGGAEQLGFVTEDQLPANWRELQAKSGTLLQLLIAADVDVSALKQLLITDAEFAQLEKILTNSFSGHFFCVMRF